MPNKPDCRTGRVVGQVESSDGSSRRMGRVVGWVGLPYYRTAARRRWIGCMKKGETLRSLLFLVELPGFEPGITGPESVVLPLHHSSIFVCAKVEHYFANAKKKPKKFSYICFNHRANEPITQNKNRKTSLFDKPGAGRRFVRAMPRREKVHKNQPLWESNFVLSS